MSVKILSMIFIGGGIGAVLRYQLSYKTWYASFLPNIIGCFFIGALFVFFKEKTNFLGLDKEFWMIGLLGGLTTFSSFKLELFELLQQNQFERLFLHIFASLLIGFLFLFIGYYFTNKLI